MNIDDLIQDLQALPDSQLDRVRGYVAALKEIEQEKETAEDRFWALIKHVNWEAETEELMVQPLIEAISKLTDEEIYEYQDQLAIKLSALDTPEHFKWYGKGELGASSDSFLYGRCEVVANGKEFYEDVLANPEKIPNDAWMQSVLHTPGESYELKHGKELERRPPIIYETGFSEAWGEERITYA